MAGLKSLGKSQKPLLSAIATVLYAHHASNEDWNITKGFLRDMMYQGNQSAESDDKPKSYLSIYTIAYILDTCAVYRCRGHCMHKRSDVCKELLSYLPKDVTLEEYLSCWSEECLRKLVIIVDQRKPVMIKGSFNLLLCVTHLAAKSVNKEKRLDTCKNLIAKCADGQYCVDLKMNGGVNFEHVYSMLDFSTRAVLTLAKISDCIKKNFGPIQKKQNNNNIQKKEAHCGLEDKTSTNSSPFETWKNHSVTSTTKLRRHVNVVQQDVELPITIDSQNKRLRVDIEDELDDHRAKRFKSDAYVISDIEVSHHVQYVEVNANIEYLYTPLVFRE